jgi:hypothetical protein
VVFGVNADLTGSLKFRNTANTADTGLISGQAGYLVFRTGENLSSAYKDITFHETNGFYPEQSGVNLGYNGANYRWANIYAVNGDLSGNLSVTGVINVKGYNTIDQSHDSSGDMQLLIGYGSRGTKSTSIYGSSIDLRACDSGGNLANLLSVQSSKVIVRSHLRPDDSVSGISVNLGGSGTDQRWANIYGVNADLSGDLVLGSTSHIDIGPLRLEYDATNKALRITKKSSSDTNKYSLYTDGFLDAGGVHQSS